VKARLAAQNGLNSSRPQENQLATDLDFRGQLSISPASVYSIRVRATAVVPWLCAARGLFTGRLAGRWAGAVWTAGPPKGSLGHLMTGKLAV
jgi:hypothetical protein